MTDAYHLLAFAFKSFQALLSKCQSDHLSLCFDLERIIFIDVI